MIFKNSNVIYLGEIPSSWKVTKYKRIAQSGMGETILKEDLNENGYPVFSATEGDDVFGYLIKPRTVLNSGDLIIPARGNSIGHVKLVSFPCTSTQTTIYSKISGINNKYLFYQAIGLKDWWFEFDNTAIPMITVNQVQNNFLLLPPQNDQIMIVDALDDQVVKIDQLIINQQKQIEKFIEYKQSVISRIITKGLNSNVQKKDSGIEWIGKIPSHWEINKVKYLGVARNGLTYSPDELTDSDKGILVLRSSNVQNGKIDLNDSVYVSKDIPNDLMVNYGDILICSRNGSRDLIGKNAIIPEKLNASFGAFMMLFRPNISSRYFYYVLNSAIFNYYLGSYLTSTINQLTLKNFNTMEIVYTKNINEQNKIVEYLDLFALKIDKQIEIKKQKMEKLKEYKKSLIYEYVTGKKQVKH